MRRGEVRNREGELKFENAELLFFFLSFFLTFTASLVSILSGVLRLLEDDAVGGWAAAAGGCGRGCDPGGGGTAT